MGQQVFTEKGLALVKNNGKINQDSIKANEKALDEGKWYLSGLNSEGKPRKRSMYLQYLRGYEQALKDLVDGTELKPWVPKERPAAQTNIIAGLSPEQIAALKKALGL